MVIVSFLPKGLTMKVHFGFLISYSFFSIFFFFFFLILGGIVITVAALMSVKRELRDDKQVMDGWDINSVDPCTWNMVACSAEGFVISL